MQKLTILLIIAFFSNCTPTKNNTKITNEKPNIIYILADDLGYGDLSCYGQMAFNTSNIDRLAAQGMRFTQHYSGSAVCAPSRSSLMTGLHTGHTPIRGNRELKNQEGQTPMPSESITIAEILKSAGYTTGAFGKWGLGFIGSEGDPNNQGFDEFYGYNCQRMAHRYYPTHLWENDKKILLEGNDWTNKVTYAPDVIQEKTLEFIEKNKDNPFFVYVPLVQPHAELIVPEDSIIAKFRGKYEEPKKVVKRYTSDYGADIIPHEYCPQPEPKAVYAAMVYRLDVYVGQIMAKLEELGIDDNTIIVFTSDNGPHTEGGFKPTYFNSTASLRGKKRDFYEGGIRTPMIVRWNNHIEAGTTTDHISAFWDVLPTFAEAANTPVKSKVDGISFLPTLTGKGTQNQHDYLYWEYAHKGGKQGVRMGKWKGVKYNLNKNGKMELYNLETDVFETRDLAEKYPEIVEKLEAILVEEHVDSELFPLK